LIQLGPTDPPGKDGARTLDESARNRLIDQLRQLRGASLPGQEDVTKQAERLAAIINTGRVGAARPMPGHAFLVPLESAGFSGREHLYVVGLDSESVGNYIRPSKTPVTDAERTAMQKQLGDEALSGLQEANSGLWASRRAIRRHSGSATLYTRIYDVRDGEPRYPSTLFLEWGGERAHAIADEDGNYDPISIRSVDAPRAGIDSEPALTLDESEDWVAAFARGNGADDDGLFRARHPGSAHGLEAMRARGSDQYTPYDGLLSEGPYPELDILGPHVFSASRLETVATTPYLYFLQHVLGIRPLDEPALEDEAWLDARRRGTILHDTFERFLRDHDDLVHTEAAEKRLEHILRERLEEATKTLAPPSAFVEASTLRRLRADAGVFLQAERARDGDAVPCRFEFGFGMPSYRQREGDANQHAEISLENGKALFLRGKVDRIDRHPDGTLSIWDYKTGSAKGYDETDPLKHGENMQWALYSYAVEELLGATVREAGYFFTSTQEMGRRIASWPRAYRADVEAIIEQLAALTQSGTFPMVKKPDEQKGWKYWGFERLHPDLKVRGNQLGDKAAWDASERPLPAHLADD
jgi:RecB family exonuclease